MISFHQWLSKYTIHLQFMITHELWNSIFLIFKRTLVIAHPPRNVIMAHYVREWICGSPLIKRNQRLDCDSLLKQSAKVSSVRGPPSRARGQGAGVWGPVSGVRHLAYCVWDSASGVGHPGSGVQSPASKVQYQTLACRVQKFRYVVYY